MKRKDCTQRNIDCLIHSTYMTFSEGFTSSTQCLPFIKNYSGQSWSFLEFVWGFLFFSLIWGVGEGVCLGVCGGGGGSNPSHSPGFNLKFYQTIAKSHVTLHLLPNSDRNKQYHVCGTCMYLTISPPPPPNKQQKSTQIILMLLFT